MRYIPHTPADVEEMCAAIGVNSVDDLFSTIPEELRLKGNLDLPAPLAEMDLRRHLRELARQNANAEEWSMFMGGGAYLHSIPAAVGALANRGEFLTAYTPYQPEVSQGTLTAMFEFQTMIAELLGMEVANASMYDGSTAMAEAVLMALRVTKRNPSSGTSQRRKILVARSLHPHYRQVLKTYLKNVACEISEIPYTPDGTLALDSLENALTGEVACVAVGYPNFFGVIEPLGDVVAAAHKAGALTVSVTTEALALGVLKSPGEWDVDIAVGEGQSLGLPLSYGGPYLGLFAAKKKLVRNMPGRLVGETVDHDGRRAYVVTLATREQHIRREKATSNICTNVALCALQAAITLSLWGRSGFSSLARQNLSRATYAKQKWGAIRGTSLPFPGATFNEFVLDVKRDPLPLLNRLQTEKILGGIPLGRWYPELKESVLITATEMISRNQIDTYTKALGKYL